MHKETVMGYCTNRESGGVRYMVRRGAKLSWMEGTSYGAAGVSERLTRIGIAEKCVSEARSV